MRIAIDLQGAQTESRFRDIGRYALSFAQAIARNRGEHEVFIALNGIFADTIEPIRASFEHILPQENIRIWHAPSPVRELTSENTSRRKNAELIRESFLASLGPDVIHITSFFEGFLDDGVTSVGMLDKTTKISASLYDLIPLLDPEQYLEPDPRYADFYLRKIEHLKKADLLFSISESSRQEGLQHLHSPADHIINVSAAIEPNFKKKAVDSASIAQINSEYGLSRPFLLSTGGYDQRKNLFRLIQSFALLPLHLRKECQLLLVGKISPGDRALLSTQIASCQLGRDEVCFAEYVSDERLIQLYNLCKLFIFPSWHEGFGLPVLEAMACGAPVLAANTSSLPEVVNMEAALFDPFSEKSISDKIQEALESDSFLSLLQGHSLQQAKSFSWDSCAERAITGWERLLETKPASTTSNTSGYKLRLAYVSPLPPERTGIADYSAELLPFLARHYEIELITDQEYVDTSRFNASFKIRSVAWLRDHANKVDRVLYHVGNSPFHAHMLSLIEDIPGTVVLHDFYLSSLMCWLETYAGIKNKWVDSLYLSHGYNAVRKRFLDPQAAARDFPVNAWIFQHALGVIVHSEYSKDLTSNWYGEELSRNLTVIPFPKNIPAQKNRQIARKVIGFNDNDFLVCSFGFLGQTKFNHRLIECWKKSKLALEENCHLVFVGECPNDPYGDNLKLMINDSGFSARIHITGFTSIELFKLYLAAADAAVQLRTTSRGETSAAIFDCMSHGLPLIANANGSFAELDPSAVKLIPEDFSDENIIDALEAFWSHPGLREELGKVALESISTHHSPAKCAQGYAEAIERFHHNIRGSSPHLIRAIAAHNSTLSKPEVGRLAQAIAATLPLLKPAKRLLLDITGTYRNDLKTGIERSARALLIALIDSPPVGYRVEPVYLSNEGGIWHYRSASSYTLSILGCPSDALADEIIDPAAGDILLGLDLSDAVVKASQDGLFVAYRNEGVQLFYMVYDLLPLRMPEVFPPNANVHHASWLRSVCSLDGAICISADVADDLRLWMKENNLASNTTRTFRIEHIHLGADLRNSAPTMDSNNEVAGVLEQIQARPTFLMVGTIEPRKAHLQVLDAFQQLWKNKVDVNLVIVGRQGWKAVPKEARRNIPETIRRLTACGELDQKLFWVSDCSDSDLEKIYRASTCLIAASHGEGFGLPLIEAAQYQLPIIARDIAVFREVAGSHAFYFNAHESSGIADAILEWLDLFNKKCYPSSIGMPCLNWKDSSLMLIEKLLRKS